MKTFIYKIVLIGVFCMFCKEVQAQAPDWSFNASNYQYSMTFTAFLSVNGTVLTSSSDQVVAFVDDEIRGVSNVEYIESIDKYITFLTVFANTNNETINFKIYNSSTQVIEEVGKTEIFKIDGSLGGVLQSYSISNSQLNDEAIFNSFGFMGLSVISIEILSNKINIVLPENTDLTSLVPVFTASNNSKVFVNNILQETESLSRNFTTPIVYKVLSEDEVNLNEYEVSVTNFVNNNSTTVVISNSGLINVNSVPVSLDIAFSNVVSGFDASDFLLENAIISSLTTLDFKKYEVNVIPLSQGIFSIQIPEGAAIDVNNNDTEMSNKSVLNYDIVRPIITSVSVDKETTSWKFLVKFSEEVLNVDISSFELMGMGSNGLEISSFIKESTTEYSMSILNTSTDIGVVSLKLKDTSGIKDASGNLIVYSDIEAYFLNNRRPLTITADLQTKVYGEEDPELTYVLSEDLLGSDVLNGSLARVEGEEVGTYRITSTLSNSNYDITFESADLSITARPLTITADVQTKVYGEEDPELTYVLSEDLLGSDVLNGSLSRAEGEDIGMYAINIGDLTLGDNYDVIFIGGIFEITENPTAGINDVVLKNKITLYPNPVVGFLNIEIENEKEIKKVLIYSLLGRLVQKEKDVISGVQLIYLSSGAYVLKVITEEGIVTKRIIKK